MPEKFYRTEVGIESFFELEGDELQNSDRIRLVRADEITRCGDPGSHLFSPTLYGYKSIPYGPPDIVTSHS
jgi:hypothetical protein